MKLYVCSGVSYRTITQINHDDIMEVNRPLDYIELPIYKHEVAVLYLEDWEQFEDRKAILAAETAVFSENENDEFKWLPAHFAYRECNSKMPKDLKVFVIGIFIKFKEGRIFHICYDCSGDIEEEEEKSLHYIWSTQ